MVSLWMPVSLLTWSTLMLADISCLARPPLLCLQTLTMLWADVGDSGGDCVGSHTAAVIEALCHVNRHFSLRWTIVFSARYVSVKIYCMEKCVIFKATKTNLEPTSFTGKSQTQVCVVKLMGTHFEMLSQCFVCVTYIHQGWCYSGFWSRVFLFIRDPHYSFLGPHT